MVLVGTSVMASLLPLPNYLYPKDPTFVQNFSEFSNVSRKQVSEYFTNTYLNTSIKIYIYGVAAEKYCEMVQF